MAPKVRFTREAVTDAAFSLVREEGMEALNARAIARRLGCSTQPLYRALSGMEEMQMAVREKAMHFFEDYIRENSAIAQTPYLSSGIAYLRFAREEGHLFRLLFMRPRSCAEQAQPNRDATYEYAAALIARSLNISMESARFFHGMSFIFVHGLASMVVTGYMDYDEAELTLMLRHEYQAIRLFVKEQEGD